MATYGRKLAPNNLSAQRNYDKPPWRRLHFSSLALLATASLGACSSRGPVATGPSSMEASIAEGKRWLSLALPDRFDAVAAADSLSAQAAHGSGPGVGSALLLAGQIRERLYRVFHGEADGREALELFTRVPPNAAGFCTAFTERLALTAELAHGPEAAAAELQKTSSTTQCREAREALLVSLRPFLTAPVTTASASASVAPAASALFAGWQDEALVASPPTPPETSPLVRVEGLTPFSEHDSARVVIQLDAPTSFHAGVASPREPALGPRVFVDIDHAVLRARKRELDLSGLAAHVRLAAHGSSVRVALDLAQPASRRVFFLPDPARIIIDLSARDVSSPSTLAPQRPAHHVTRLVLDPGHGGHDPGAVGPNGLREKDVTLDIARRAAPLIARELGVSTLVTRDHDDFVPLEERTARANAFGADLLLSIHCNASLSPGTHGVETFVLDTSSDARASRVAARENGSSAQEDAQVSSLLGQLHLAYLGAESHHFAELLQRAAVASLEPKYAPISDHGVKTAGFFVLIGARMPSALFETSFVSNPTEETRLGSEDYRQKLADAIVNAIRAYMDGR